MGFPYPLLGYSGIRIIHLGLRESPMPPSRHTNRYKQFRRLLKDARKEAGLTQAQVAGLLGRNQSFVAKYENGERRLDVIEFLDVAAALKLDATKLIRSLLSN